MPHPTYPGRGRFAPCRPSPPGNLPFSSPALPADKALPTELLGAQRSRDPAPAGEAPEAPCRVDAAEVAKILRRVLKRHFPDQRFYVRTDRYSGGSSIDVSWVDGPTLAEVEPLVSVYRGADFDGMRDLKTYREAVVRRDDGTLKRVRYGADFIFPRREASDGARAEVSAWLEEALGDSLDDDKLYPFRYVGEPGVIAQDRQHGTWGSALAEQVFQAREFPRSKRRPRYI